MNNENSKKSMFNKQHSNNCSSKSQLMDAKADKNTMRKDICIFSKYHHRRFLIIITFWEKRL